MRIAYLVTAYRDLHQLQRLCECLRREDPSSIVLVQFDRGSPLAPEAAELGLRVIFTAFPIRWGDGTYARAIVESLRVLSEEPWDWVVLLSGQDYPVRPLETLRQELESSEHVAYSPAPRCWRGDAAVPAELHERYGYRYLWPRRRWPTAMRVAARLVSGPLSLLSGHRLRLQPRPRGDGPGLGIKRRRTIFSEHRPCWMGPDYVVIRRAATTALLELVEREPELLDYFDHTFIPSEAVFASMLRWVGVGTVADRNFHFMRFTGKANPRPVTMADLEELWELGVIFARKLDDDSAWVEQVLPMRSPPT